MGECGFGQAPVSEMEIGTMPRTGLAGPHALTDDTINEVVTKVSAGVYAAGRVNKENLFLISYIGRSDSDLSVGLHDYVGKYSKFKFGYFDTPRAAFEKQCHLYHDFGPPDNRVHPARPMRTKWSCPRCRAFD
jgi:hypothetical protein